MGVREYHTKIKMGTGIKVGTGHQTSGVIIIIIAYINFFLLVFCKHAFFFFLLSFWRTYAWTLTSVQTAIITSALLISSLFPSLSLSLYISYHTGVALALLFRACTVQHRIDCLFAWLVGYNHTKDLTKKIDWLLPYHNIKVYFSHG